MTTNRSSKKIVAKIVCIMAFVMASQISIAADDEILKTVISEGIGQDLDSAAKKAAENALTQVVGEFVQVDKQISKTSEVENGVKSESKKIDLNTREYSQGYIKSFKVKKSIEEDGQYRVRAEVVVRVDQFKAFVAKKASGEIEITPDVYSGVIKNNDNSSNKYDIIANTILIPLFKGEAYKITPSHPMPTEEFIVQDQSRQKKWNDADEWIQTRYLNGMSSIAKQNSVVIPLNVIIDKNFKENMIATLKETSSDKKHIKLEDPRVDCSTFKLQELFPSYKSEADFVLVLIENQNIAEAYYLKDMHRVTVGENDSLTLKKFKSGQLPSFPDLVLSFVDKGSSEISDRIIIRSAGLMDNHNGASVIASEPWSLLSFKEGPFNECTRIYMNKKTNIYLGRSMEYLSKISKIKFELQDN